MLVIVGVTIELDAPIAVRPARYDVYISPTPYKQMRVLLVGDTGEPNDELTALQKQVMKEQFDLVLALGDLIYPYGEVCRTGALDAETAEVYAERIGAFYKPLQKLTLMVIGNHEVDGEPRDPAREACFVDYAAAEPQLYFPALSYSMDFGAAAFAVVNTNLLDDAQARMVQDTFAKATGWKILVGHHVLVCYHDKEDETHVREWLQKHNIRPDLYVNGHAHIQQFGIYDNIPAATTGATSKLRERPSCPPDCGEGQLWGESVRGYVMLDVAPDLLSLVYRDTDGRDLWRWQVAKPLALAPSPAP